MTAIHRALSFAVIASLALALAACSKDAPAPAPTAAPADAPLTPSGELPPPDTAEPAPSPAPDPPPATEPSTEPKPTSVEPALDAMHAATPSSKMSVPVDLRYQFESDPLVNQPVILHLAAVPRVAGTRLHVSIKAADGLQIAAGPVEFQKAAARSAYRQQLSVTRTAAAPDELRVLVTMDMAEGSGFGFYSIPLSGGKTAQKHDSVKQR